MSEKLSKEESQRAKHAQQIKAMTESFDPIAIAEIYAIVAQEQRIKFNAYLKAGFTEDQAIKLCKP